MKKSKCRVRWRRSIKMHAHPHDLTRWDERCAQSMILGLREEASAAAACACTYAAHCWLRIYDSTMAGSVELLLRQPIGFKRGSRGCRAKSFSDVIL